MIEDFDLDDTGRIIKQVVDPDPDKEESFDPPGVETDCLFRPAMPKERWKNDTSEVKGQYIVVWPGSPEIVSGDHLLINDTEFRVKSAFDPSRCGEYLRIEIEDL